MQKISPFLWFNGNAEEAAKFYTSIFKDSKILGTMPGPDGTVLGVSFQIEGQEFKALNGGPLYTFTPAISFFVNCETQEEVDELWEKLLAGGGKEDMCGWLRDKYGVSWQIIPTILGELLSHKDRARAGKAMNAMLQMRKIDIETLRRAAA
ncbi:MAG TPA: VOC family protein [Terriglobales bacterium]|nr:VOC family protein [Terriglobales bacterium]